MDIAEISRTSFCALMAKKIGIFGGSFDPIHLGHLKLAEELMRVRHLDEVWFCPAFISPHKLEQQPASSKDRLAMLQLALENKPWFKILDTEIVREAPSFTIDTLQELLASQAGKPDSYQFYLILGEDALAGFQHWKQAEDILRLVPFLIGSRFNKDAVPDFSSYPEFQKVINAGWTPTSVLEISSTEVRNRLKEGLDCSQILPIKVLDYIKAHHLYYFPYEEKNH